MCKQTSCWQLGPSISYFITKSIFSRWTKFLMNFSFFLPESGWKKTRMNEMFLWKNASWVPGVWERGCGGEGGLKPNEIHIQIQFLSAVSIRRVYEFVYLYGGEFWNCFFSASTLSLCVLDPPGPITSAYGVFSIRIIGWRNIKKDKKIKWNFPITHFLPKQRVRVNFYLFPDFEFEFCSFLVQQWRATKPLKCPFVCGKN